MTRKLQSPSSINTYNQCPRKYFYTYIMKIETGKSIYLVRGGIMHTVLEEFFKINPKTIDPANYSRELMNRATELFIRNWEDNKADLQRCELSMEELYEYYTESMTMLKQWVGSFCERLSQDLWSCTLTEAFNKHRPETEVHLISEKHGVQGYIDAIHNNNGSGVELIDYKTSKKDYLSKDYRLQLAIYCLLYREKFNKLPKRVGVDFLRAGRRFIPVTKELIEWAKDECKDIRRNTSSMEIDDYPKKESKLCKWGEGRNKRCEYYEYCFE